MADIRFDGKVAIVTGAGGGLGRAHALELARRGARVVVNDLGGSMDGSGAHSEASLKVVEEIKAAGGEAMANGSSVTDDAGVAKMVKDTMDAWGRIDILVANAGILRDKTFAKMELADFEIVVDVHLFGTVKPAKAVWEIMREQNYGRIVVTTSSSRRRASTSATMRRSKRCATTGRRSPTRPAPRPTSTAANRPASSSARCRGARGRFLLCNSNLLAPTPRAAPNLAPASARGAR